MLASPLVLLGVILTLGVLLGDVSERVKIPWITGCIVAGVLLEAAGLLHPQSLAGLDGFTQAALALIAFNIGGQLVIARLKAIGRSIALLAIAQLLGPFILVLGAETMLGLAFPAALVVAAVAPATAPTTTYSVIQRRQASGPFVDRALGILALNDAATVLLFSIASTIALAVSGGVANQAATIGTSLAAAALNEVLSIAAGAVLGAAYLLARRLVEDGTPGCEARLTAMLLGLLVISIRGAIALGLSHLLVPLSFGAVCANGVDGAERQHVHNLTRAFEEPLFIVFFVLAGAHLPLSATGHFHILVAAVVYLAARFAGKYGGVALTAATLRLDQPTRRYLGLCFPSQGALAMGLILAFHSSSGVKQLPLAGLHSIESAVSIILVGVLLSEIIGPLVIDYAVRRGSSSESPSLGLCGNPRPS